MAEQKKDIPRLRTLNYDPVLFHNDEQLYFVYKKIEAISGAVFLITHSVADSEVIKQTLREQSIKTMNQIVSLISKTTVDVSDIQIVSSSVTYTNSLLDIAFWSGVVSQMNVSMIQREIAAVYKVVNDLIAKYKDTFFLDSTFFDSQEPQITHSSISNYNNADESDELRSATHAYADSTIEQDTITSVKANETLKQTAAFEPATSKMSDTKEPENKGQNIQQELKDTSKSQTDARVYTPTTGSNKERRDTIINLIKDKGSVGIKDVSIAIPLVSEKTIQRELLSLVGEGILKKEGERRWSTYSLV